MLKRNKFGVTLLSLSLAIVNVGCEKAEPVVAQQKFSQISEQSQPAESVASQETQKPKTQEASAKGKEESASPEDAAAIRKSLTRLTSQRGHATVDIENLSSDPT